MNLFNRDGTQEICYLAPGLIPNQTQKICYLFPCLISNLFNRDETQEICYLFPGLISNLFNRDETQEICAELTPVMKREHPRRPPTPETLADYFLCRVRQNLHVVLCFSPVSGVQLDGR